MKVIVKGRENRDQLEVFSIEEFVPAEHLLRKIDSAAFDGIYDRLVEKNPEIKAIVADAGYKTPWISKRILDDGRIPVLPYKDQ